jgi:hypothetical protein
MGVIVGNGVEFFVSRQNSTLVTTLGSTTEAEASRIAGHRPASTLREAIK